MPKACYNIIMSNTQENYEDGFRNGRLDAQLGLRLEIALHSNRPGYSSGYYDGQNSFLEKINAAE